MTETNLLKKVRVLACKIGVVLFRNNVGVGRTLYGDRKIRFGLIVGSSDGIGWRSFVIPQEFVGRRVAIFVGVETKAKKGVLSDDQKTFQANLKAAGGIAIVAKCEDDVIRGVKEWETDSKQ